MDRKEFIKSTCGICVALGSGLLGNALVAGCKTPLGIVKATAKDHILSIALSDFATGNFKIIRVSNYDYDLAVQKQPDGSFEVLVLKCSHGGQPLTKTGDTYYCTQHGSKFSHNGQVLKGPAEQPLKKLASSVVGEQLVVRLV